MRVKIKELEPKAYEAMYYLEKYLENSDLTNLHKELIKIRASQINKCAYCIDLHIKTARKLGETEQRIYMLNAWKDTQDLYTEEEQIILQMTEEITLIHNHLSDETYNKAAHIFTPNYLAQIIIAIAVINTWNRIGIATEMRPGKD